MIELRGEHVVLRALEREHCHTLWEMTEIAEDVPTEHVQLGLAQEQADKWFEEIQGKQNETMSTHELINISPSPLSGDVP